MKQSQVVILTNSDDPHADQMIGKLTQIGHEPIRMNSDDFVADAPFRVVLAGREFTGQIKIMRNGRAINLEAVRSVWLRRPHPIAFPADLDQYQRVFAEAETEHALSGLWATLDCYWVSRPEAIRAAGWKVEQLHRAARLDFDIPRSLVSTEPDAVRSFYDDCGGQIVYKRLGGALVARGVDRGSQDVPALSMPTVAIAASELAALEAVRLAPCLFQERIDKRTELRVTVIGDEVFTVGMEPMDPGDQAVDSRTHLDRLRYSRFRLPPDLESRCVELVRSYDLAFAAIDLIRTPDGRHVFLELNAAGQFMFFEAMVPELKMTAALAGCLLRGGNA